MYEVEGARRRFRRLDGDRRGLRAGYGIERTVGRIDVAGWCMIGEDEVEALWCGLK